MSDETTRVVYDNTIRVLGIETSTTYLSLGWLEVTAGTVRRSAAHSALIGRAHSELILGQLKAFMAEQSAVAPDVIAVGVGPGSYTGVRVGVSLALGLARGWNASAVGVPSLEAIAGQRDGVVAVTLDARKGMVYSAVYRVQDQVILETLVSVAKRPLEEFAVFAPRDAIWLRDAAPDGLTLARLGLAARQRGQTSVEISYL